MTSRHREDDVLVHLDRGILAITLNRPERLNALYPEHMRDVADRIIDAGQRDDVRLITLTGSGGRAFCAGADISPGENGESGLPGEELLDAVNRLATAITGCPKLVVALVNGPAAGVGVSLVLSADIALAVESAYLKTGFDAIGLIPDGGGTALLHATLGRSRALSCAILGDKVSAEEALRVGLYSRVWTREEFARESGELTLRLSQGPSLAYASAKLAINTSALPSMTDVLRRERDLQLTLLGSSDHAEGMAAFNEKRTARFVGG